MFLKDGAAGLDRIDDAVQQGDRLSLRRGINQRLFPDCVWRMRVSIAIGQDFRIASPTETKNITPVRRVPGATIRTANSRCASWRACMRFTSAGTSRIRRGIKWSASASAMKSAPLMMKPVWIGAVRGGAGRRCPSPRGTMIAREQSGWSVGRRAHRNDYRRRVGARPSTSSFHGGMDALALCRCEWILHCHQLSDAPPPPEYPALLPRKPPSLHRLLLQMKDTSSAEPAVRIPAPIAATPLNLVT